LIEVSGGVVQSVNADEPIEVLLVDYDNIGAGDGPPYDYKPDIGSWHVDEALKCAAEAANKG
jgi:hypothetical protein